MDKIKNFFWPNRGIRGAFAVWVIFFAIIYSMLASSPAFENLLGNPIVILQDVILNLLILYFFTCLSIWAYERTKKR